MLINHLHNSQYICRSKVHPDMHSIPAKLCPSTPDLTVFAISNCNPVYNAKAPPYKVKNVSRNFGHYSLFVGNLAL